jgi:hypothetical protein
LKGARPTLDQLAQVTDYRLHLFATGQQIFCARCSVILDGPKAVSFAIGGRAQKVVCAKCWDEKLEPRLETVKAQVLAEFGRLPEIEIFDPRQIPDIEEMDRWTPQ